MMPVLNLHPLHTLNMFGICLNFSNRTRFIPRLLLLTVRLKLGVSLTSHGIDLLIIPGFHPHQGFIPTLGRSCSQTNAKGHCRSFRKCKQVPAVSQSIKYSSCQQGERKPVKRIGLWIKLLYYNDGVDEGGMNPRKRKRTWLFALHNSWFFFLLPTRA